MLSRFWLHGYTKNAIYFPQTGIFQKISFKSSLIEKFYLYPRNPKMQTLVCDDKCSGTPIYVKLDELTRQIFSSRETKKMYPHIEKLSVRDAVYFFLPYLARDGANFDRPGEVILLNRRYKPLSVIPSDHVRYEDYRCHVANFSKISELCEKKNHLPDHAWFYGDLGEPWRSASNRKDYIELIEKASKVMGNPELEIFPYIGKRWKAWNY
jgi:hypothetical protein